MPIKSLVWRTDGDGDGDGDGILPGQSGRRSHLPCLVQYSHALIG